MANKTEQDKATANGVRALVVLWGIAFVVVIVFTSGVLGVVFEIIGRAWGMLAEAGGSVFSLILVAAGWATVFVVGVLLLTAFGLAVDKWRKRGAKKDAP